MRSPGRRDVDFLFEETHMRVRVLGFTGLMRGYR